MLFNFQKLVFRDRRKDHPLWGIWLVEGMADSNQQWCDQQKKGSVISAKNLKGKESLNMYWTLGNNE